MTDPRFIKEPWIFGAPDGLSSDLHTAAELEQAWEAMRERIRELERERDEAVKSMLFWRDTQYAGQCALYHDERAARGKAESTLATLRAELRQARRREAVLELGLETNFVIRGVLVVGSPATDAHQAYSRAGIIGKAYGSLREAGDACAAALHAAGLVEDEDAE